MEMVYEVVTDQFFHELHPALVADLLRDPSHPC